MFAKLALIAILGIVSADGHKRFLYPNQQSGPFQNPFGGGGGGGGGSGSTGYHSCTPQQGYCSLQCDHGYVKGPMGCDFCMCNTQHQYQTTTIAALMPNITTIQQVSSTVSPTVSTELPTTVSATTTVSPATSTATVSECDQARDACATSCGSAGYLVDPSDCTFCLCKENLG